MYTYVLARFTKKKYMYDILIAIKIHKFYFKFISIYTAYYKISTFSYVYDEHAVNILLVFLSFVSFFFTFLKRTNKIF